MDQSPKIKPKAIKLQEENIEEYLCNHRIDQDFFGLHKNYVLLFSKETVKRMKR